MSGSITRLESMTEQNLSNPAQAENPDAFDWPASTGQSSVGDPAVDAVLERLGALPELPVASHGEVYAGLHDDLVEALNEDVTGQDVTAQDVAGQAAAGTPGRPAGNPRP